MVALEQLHEHNFIYRAVQPENITLDASGYPRLSELCFAKRMDGAGSRTYTVCGAPEYMPPEIINGQGHNRAVDYWALGVLMYEMLTG